MQSANQKVKKENRIDSSAIIVEGSKPLRGEVKLSGAKNSGFKLLVAALLSDENSQISNLPEITDLLLTTNIIKELGGNISLDGKVAKVSGSNLRTYKIPNKFSDMSRANIYFVGPLIHRFGKVFIPLLGGCDIGARPLNRHMQGFRALGIKVEDKKDGWYLQGHPKGGHYKFPKVTHGGTETLILASVLASGTTILDNAALEPEIDDIISFLNSLGAKIQRKPRRRIIIEGVDKLHGSSYTCMPDRNEAVTYAVAALATKGDIFVKGARASDLAIFLQKVSEAGGSFHIEKDGIRFKYNQLLSSTNITTKAHPGFMTDWQSLWTILMTQANGISTVKETIFENRFQHISFLMQMGANISFFNPKVINKEKYYDFNISDDSPKYFHAIKIKGPTPLQSVQAKIPDLRGGATILLASLVAEGQSRLENADIIKRGYSDFVSNFRKIGAKIEGVS